MEVENSCPPYLINLENSLVNNKNLINEIESCLKSDNRFTNLIALLNKYG